MYKGNRDPEIRIVIPYKYCRRYQSKSSGTWIEIFTPPETIAEYGSQYATQFETKWGSIMVRPEQVCNIGDGLNIIRLNDGAQINNSVKDPNRVVISTEIITPDIITGRWLKFYRYDLFRRCGIDPTLLDNPSKDIYDDMIRSGQTMQFYMNRLPLIL